MAAYLVHSRGGARIISPWPRLNPGGGLILWTPGSDFDENTGADLSLRRFDEGHPDRAD
jgi:hypothetical protein